EHAVPSQCGALLVVEPLPEQVLGEVWSRGEADQGVDALRDGERGQEHDPGAHAGPDEERGTRDARLEHRQGVVSPRADRAVQQPAGGEPVAPVVEPYEGLAAL